MDSYKNLQAEQSIIGGLMLVNSSWDRIAGTIRAEDFSHPQHKLIFHAITALADKGKPLDVVTISSQLGKHLNEAGGLDYLKDIAINTPSAANIKTYVELVHEHLEALEIQQAEIEGNEAMIMSAKNIQPEAITWLWQGWLAAGKLHILAGAPGTGKSTLALALAAALTTQGRWPDGTQAPLGDVLLWSGEDDPTDTLVPRLMACGADRSRVHIVSGVLDGGRPRPFDPAADIPLLEAAAKRIDRPIRLLMVDPVVMAVVRDSHKNAETRRDLQPLVDIGHHLRCAVMGITHLTKNTSGRELVERVTGSLAFGALARIVMVAAKMPDDDGREGVRLLARAKSNISLDNGGFEYHIDVVEIPGHPGINNTRVTWGAAVDGTARDLLSQAEALTDPEERSAIDEAKDFLLDLLVDGPVPKKEIEKDADGMGISLRTMDRAKKILGIESHKEGFAKGGVWKWRLPTKDAKNPLSTPHNNVVPLGEFGNLSEENDKPKPGGDDHDEVEI